MEIRSAHCPCLPVPKVSGLQCWLTKRLFLFSRGHNCSHLKVFRSLVQILVYWPKKSNYKYRMDKLLSTGKFRPNFCTFSLCGYDVHKFTQSPKSQDPGEVWVLSKLHGLNSWAGVNGVTTNIKSTEIDYVQDSLQLDHPNMQWITVP